ncbi:hypothetical protein CC1G_13995 [Coprinopsis cinerea okayama7|uniref:Uncharacterized protein n=1 Tax=Coprinopsis cinerea (strain Okayama-7 / 130 / ATCC MYA-4618 / FGSC 9003) TaxID=240176 RepID=D6RL02_COPC7|nr:hypothetical protein CC1G_13995 [Coprinopsis cinerea okayama7\|eukprot:XP_002911956.1 hypothetical protein CC1G_13995 [Coprinopsis cinerea okayama7\
MDPRQRLKPAATLAELPPEIWLSILREATAEAEPLRPPLHTVFIRNWSRGRPTKTARRRRKQSMTTKRNVVLVCKAWHSLALPFLYERLFLTRREQIISVLRNIENGGTDLGSYTSRLDIYGNSGLLKPASNQFLHDLASLLSHLPRLLVLIIQDLIGQDGDSFLLHASPGLEYISWAGSEASPSTWAKFVTGHPNLRTVGAPSAQDHRLKVFVCPEVNQKLEHVTDLATVWGFDAGQWCEKWVKPGTIRYLNTASPRSYDDVLFYGNSRLGISNPIVTHGTSLTTLHYHISHFGFEIDQEARHLDLALKHCTNLRQLNLFFKYRWCFEIATLDPRPNITTLGIMRTGITRRRTAKQLFAVLLQVKDHWLPNLQVIQFLHEGTIVQLRHYFVHHGLERKFHERGIALQYYDGAEYVDFLTVL